MKRREDTNSCQANVLGCGAEKTSRGQIRSRCLQSAEQSQVVLDIAAKRYTLDVILEYSLFSTAIKLCSLDVILEYSKARIREEKTSAEHTTSTAARSM